MSLITQTSIIVTTGALIVPAVQTFTGTYTTVGITVTVAGGVLLDEYLPGLADGYLYSTGKGEYRKISSILSQTTFLLETPFTTDVAIAETVKVVRPQVDSITANVTGAGDGTVWNIYSGLDTLKTGQAYEFSADQHYKLLPLVFNGTGTSIEIIIHN